MSSIDMQTAAANLRERNAAGNMNQTGVNAFGFSIYMPDDKPCKSGKQAGTVISRSAYVVLTGEMEHGIGVKSTQAGFPFTASTKFPHAVQCGLPMKDETTDEVAVFAPFTAFYIDGNASTTPRDITEGSLVTLYNMGGSAFRMADRRIGARKRMSGMIERTKYAGNRIRDISPLPFVVTANSKGFFPKVFPPFSVELAHEAVANDGYLKTAPVTLGVFGPQLVSEVEKAIGRKMLWSLTLNEKTKIEYEYVTKATNTTPEVRTAVLKCTLWGVQLGENGAKPYNFVVDLTCYGSKFDWMGYTVKTAPGYKFAMNFVLRAVPYMNFAALMVTEPKREAGMLENASLETKVSTMADISESEDSDDDEETVEKKKQTVAKLKSEIEEGAPRFGRSMSVARVFFEMKDFLRDYFIRVDAPLVVTICKDNIFKGSLTPAEKTLADEAATRGDTRHGSVLLTIPSETAKKILKNAGKEPKHGRVSTRSFWLSSTFLMSKLQPISLREFCERCNGLSEATIAERTATMSADDAAIFKTKFGGLTPSENSDVVRFLQDKSKLPTNPSPALSAMIEYVKNSMLNSPSNNVPIDSMIVFSYKEPKKGDEVALLNEVVFGHPVTGEQIGTEDAEAPPAKRAKTE